MIALGLGLALAQRPAELELALRAFDVHVSLGAGHFGGDMPSELDAAAIAAGMQTLKTAMDRLSELGQKLELSEAEALELHDLLDDISFLEVSSVDRRRR